MCRAKRASSVDERIAIAAVKRELLPGHSRQTCNCDSCAQTSFQWASTNDMRLRFRINMAELVGMNFVLQAIGSVDAVERARIMEAGLGQFDDFRNLVDKDICEMSSGFGKLTQAQGRIVFGLGSTKKLTGVMH